MEEEAHQRLENDDELVAKPAKIYPIHSHSFYSLLPTLFTLLPFFSSLLYIIPTPTSCGRHHRHLLQLTTCPSLCL
jgi:hypothetical protein